MKITFLGAVEEVTGSKYLVESGNTKVLVDCGMFQGKKEIRKRNWDEFPIAPSSIDAIIVTHAHMDHTGYIPVLVKNGFKGVIYCTKATYELCAILLVDSGYLQEEDAKKINDAGYSSHSPALPLYNAYDAELSLKFFHPVNFDVATKVKDFTFTLKPAGHILGASFVILSDDKKTISFSGDLGRPDQPIMKAPTHLTHTDYLVVESTYGNRVHEEFDSVQMLADVINKTVAKGGVTIIPAFAVGRTQIIIYYLYQLLQKKAIPNIPIFLDSPMAINVTNLYCNFTDEHKLPANICTDIFAIAQYTQSVAESRKIDRIDKPAIIIVGSGMADGGRILDHFKRFISDAKNTVVFVGFQAKGTNGRDLIEGAKTISIHGKTYEVHAQIEKINSLSAHADSNEILEWLSYFKTAPQKVFITHGEIDAAEALQKKIKERFGWDAIVPKYLESFNLD